MSKLSVLALVCAAGVLLTSPVHAQVSLTAPGSAYTQSFDTLPASGSPTWTNNSTIPGWYHARTGSDTTIVANDGGNNVGNLYSYGTGTATDRALGSVGSSNTAAGDFFWGVRLKNNTGATITSLDVSYIGEQWRKSGVTTAQTVAFSYLVGSPTVTGSLSEFQSAGVAVPALDFTSPVHTATGAPLDGNLAANRVTRTFSITGLSIPDGTEVMLRWSDPDHSSADHGLAIDSFSVTPQEGAVGGSVDYIDEVQGPGAATPIPGATVTVEGVVTGDFQAGTQLQGFFLQEEDIHVDADPLTSEGIFIFCSGCPTAVSEGQRVRVTGTVSEFNNLTEITASSAGSVVVMDAGNHLAEVTPAPIDLPVVGNVNASYEAREGMLVTFVDTLTVSEYFELFRFGHIELFEGGRPRQFTEISAPSVSGYAAHLADLDRRRIILDDDDNTPNAPLNLADGSQSVFHPQANGGFSIGTQGTDFFRGGDLVAGLTGILHWSFAGSGSVDSWRIRPTAATPATFTVANPRPATAPAVGGAIKAAGFNLLNYFTTIDTTASNSSGPCGPSGTLDCRGADSAAELNRQRERTSIVICGLNADVVGLVEMENTASVTIMDLLGAVNARCSNGHPYAAVSTGGTLGTDAIRVALIYRTGIVSPVGSPLVDLDPVHNRPPTAQTFDVIDAANPALGERFTVIANHFKSKGCPGSGSDADAGDGAACFNGRRTAQANRLLTWINGTVVPAAGDPDVLLLGDFNAYAQEDPVTALTDGGYTDLGPAFLGPAAHSYLFDGQLGHLDYAFASSSLATQVTGVGIWRINADEVPLFDYSDEVKDTGEAAFEEKPDGSALIPPRAMFQPASPYRASDHDPVLVGLFPADNFFTLKPCRVADTRLSTPLQNGVPRTFTVQGVCGVPATAKAVVLNVTIVGPTASGGLTVHAADISTPGFPTLPFKVINARSLNAVVGLSQDGNGQVKGVASVAGNGTVHLALDVTGYFE